jgi:ParB-like chromosome segregation protein Spo0J
MPTKCETEAKLGKIATSLGAKLCTIALEDIEVTDRFRKDYGDLNELALSITEKGQLQNLVVCTNGIEPGSKPYRLLAGGRRYKTMTEKLNMTEASALVFSHELDKCEMLEVEWEENSRRKDLSWQEDVAIKAEIQKERTLKFGVKVGKSADSVGVSIRDTAAALNVSPATMSQDVNLARAAEIAPQIFEGCKTKKDALKALKLATESIMRAERAEKIQEKIGDDSKMRSILDRYIIGDFFEHESEIPDGTIDFCEIDPPYAMNLDKAKKLSGTRYSMEDYNEVSLEDYGAFMAHVIKVAFRVMTTHSYGVLWHAPDPWGPILYELLTTVGFETTRLTGKWIKPSGQCHQPQRYLANACEEFFYFWIGSPSIVRQGRTNVFAYTPVAATKKLHPTERPMELIQEILSTFCWDGSRILVPFLGSGKTILAAETLGMKAFGYELSESFKEGFTIQAHELMRSK